MNKSAVCCHPPIQAVICWDRCTDMTPLCTFHLRDVVGTYLGWGLGYPLQRASGPEWASGPPEGEELELAPRP